MEVCKSNTNKCFRLVWHKKIWNYFEVNKYLEILNCEVIETRNRFSSYGNFSALFMQG